MNTIRLPIPEHGTQEFNVQNNGEVIVGSNLRSSFILVLGNAPMVYYSNVNNNPTGPNFKYEKVFAPDGKFLRRVANSLVKKYG